MLDFTERIRDPVHGFILYNELEKEIINSKPFQRLRNIRQLAFTDYVYPGATHTRFSHSLGVMEFATKIFDILLGKKAHRDLLEEEFGWNDNDLRKHRQLLRLSALLHDVGHAPFSHASESLFKCGLEHEDYSVKIIQDTEIGEIIDKYSGSAHDITKNDVAAMISGKTLGKDVFLQDIISGPIDADRIDYLIRDSIYCGVDYGRFDYQRLIHTFVIAPAPELPKEGEGNLAVEEGGKHAVEGLILARYFMFTQVYFHRVRHAYDIHLGDALKQILPEGYFPENVNEYMKWDDVKVFSQMRENKELEIVSRILNRNHFREVHKTGEHIGEPEQMNCYFVWEKLKERFGEEKVCMDKAHTSLHKFDKVDLFIKVEDDYKTIGECSRILKDFNQPITQMRILADNSIKEEAKAFCRNINEEFKKSQKQKR